MDRLGPHVLRYAVWGLAFVCAERVYAARSGGARDRMAVGLLVGVVVCHLGWLLLHLPRAIDAGNWVLQPGGASVLFLPLGVLLVAPWREALAALPLALGVARLGCLPYDCCYASPWNALPELSGMLALHVAARRWPRHTTPIVLCGFGAIRLLSLPLRRDPIVAPFVDPAWVALAWVGAGVLLRNRIGSAENAREWFTERSEPLLRTLALVLGVWLVFPVASLLLGDPETTLLAGSLAVLALLLAVRRPRVPRVRLASLAVFVGSTGVGVAVALLAGSSLGQPGLAPRSTGTSGLAHGLAVVAIAPIFEELLYRERLLGVLRDLWGGLPALLLSSALFALGHMDASVMPIAFAGGLVCGGVMLRTGSLAAVIGLHAGWNLGVLAVS